MAKPKLKIAVVGAGASGLCAAKHALDYKYEVTVYEQTANIGGTWVYTDQVGNDEYGLPIHTSMYKGLLTNTPIEMMGFPEYPFPSKGRSFVSSKEVISFYQSYASAFHLNDVIKFRHYVVRVRPVENNRCEVIVKNIRNDTYKTVIYDAIFICNGHYHKPYYPDFDGLKNFTGHTFHSHDYRRPEQFRDEEVLIIGAGPSGKDILKEIATTAKRIAFSHHRDTSHSVFPENVRESGDIKRFTENGAQFVDGKQETFTCILFCTGYYYSFPFLSVDSGICIDDKFYIQPLYKHLINVNFPTMALVGLQYCASTSLYDIQTRFCLKYWSGEKELPSKADMLEDTSVQMKKQWEKSNTKRQSHFLGDDQENYFQQLSDAAELKNAPEVYFKLLKDTTELRIQHPTDFRLYNYKIIDDSTFTRSNPVESKLI